MQPNLLSIQQEEQPASSQDLIQPEAASTPDPVQRGTIPAVEATDANPAIRVEKKRSKPNIVAVSLVLLFIFGLFLSFAGVGYWAYMLNNKLNTAQQQLTALQSEHTNLQADYASLTSENKKLNNDLTQSRAELEKTTTNLTTTQADLSRSKQDGEKLQTQFEEAGDLVEVLYATATSDEESDIFKIDRLITESNNKDLVKHWDTFTSSPSEDAFSAFLDYLILATRNSLK